MSWIIGGGMLLLAAMVVIILLAILAGWDETADWEGDTMPPGDITEEA